MTGTETIEWLASLDDEQGYFLAVVWAASERAGLRAMPVAPSDLAVLRLAPDTSPVTRCDVRKGRWTRLFAASAPLGRDWSVYTVDVSRLTNEARRLLRARGVSTGRVCK